MAGSSSCSSSSSSDGSASSSRGSHSSRRSRGSSRGRRRSRSSTSSSSRSRSRSHPRCHRVSSHSCCHHRHYSPPRLYRAHSRSYSPSPERSSGRRRYRQRSRSPSPYGYSRRSSCSPVHWWGGRFVGRYRCRFSPSPDRYRSHRSRSRSQERTAIRLSHAEKKYLLDIAKTNAARILGVQNLELPASLKELEEQEEKRSSVQEKRFRDDPAQVRLAHTHLSPQT
ncbi:arginine/serine-rich protein 1 [Triplophysa rosa]|uniref:Arginine/serine-rich protein 1 n=1 Tax=Triplophysa rosa TaxID=992332 RepID=A0A9W7WNN4_TRIRA|nr:arginine/serine-rich protein 1 [Triplophysa rosa]